MSTVSKRRNMWLSIIILILLCIAIISLIVLYPRGKESDPVLEEYKIYDTILKGNNYNKIIIKKYTNNQKAIDKESIDYVVNKIGKFIEKDTIDDFMAKNQKQYLLTTKFLHEKDKCYLISDDEINELIKAEKGIKHSWDDYYKKYPNSHGINELSKVGFNKKMTQALVYEGRKSGSLQGSGYIVLLTKAWGSWTIKYSIMIWIS